MTVLLDRLGKAAVVSALLASLAACVPPPVQDCTAESFAPVPSEIGLNYATLYGADLAGILSQGEQEFFSGEHALTKLPPYLQAEVKADWATTVRRIFDQTLNHGFNGTGETSFDTLRLRAPILLSRLKACGGTLDPRLNYLADLDLVYHPGAGGAE